MPKYRTTWAPAQPRRSFIEAAATPEFLQLKREARLHFDIDLLRVRGERDLADFDGHQYALRDENGVVLRAADKVDDLRHWLKENAAWLAA